jgi:hypothetical protein
MISDLPFSKRNWKLGSGPVTSRAQGFPFYSILDGAVKALAQLCRFSAKSGIINIENF